MNRFCSSSLRNTVVRIRIDKETKEQNEVNEWYWEHYAKKDVDAKVVTIHVKDHRINKPCQKPKSAEVISSAASTEPKGKIDQHITMHHTGLAFAAVVFSIAFATFNKS